MSRAESAWDSRRDTSSVRTRSGRQAWSLGSTGSCWALVLQLGWFSTGRMGGWILASPAARLPATGASSACGSRMVAEHVRVPDRRKGTGCSSRLSTAVQQHGVLAVADLQTPEKVA